MNEKRSEYTRKSNDVREKIEWEVTVLENRDIKFEHIPKGNKEYFISWLSWVRYAIDTHELEFLHTLLKDVKFFPLQMVTSMTGEIISDICETYTADDYIIDTVTLLMFNILITHSVMGLHNAITFDTIMSELKTKPETYYKSKPEPEPGNGFIYLLYSEFGIKIGRTYNPDTRINHLKIQLPFKITKTEIYEVSDCIEMERILHKRYKDFRLNGEWFQLTETELIDIREELTFLGKSI